MLCLLQPTANYDLAIIEDYLAGNSKIKISIKKQNGVVVIFGEPWQLLLTGSAVPRIYWFDFFLDVQCAFRMKTEKENDF